MAGTNSPMLPADFFTVQSMLTLTGATGATFVICNGLQRAFDFNPKWLALAVAEVITIGGAAFSNPTAAGFFIGVLNGFLVYCTAVGANSITGSAPPGPVARGASAAADPQRARRAFLTKWQ